jgi:hypothetical protein
LSADRDAAELFYMAYLGFILRRRHAPHARHLFSILAENATKAFRIKTATSKSKFAAAGHFQ